MISATWAAFSPISLMPGRRPSSRMLWALVPSSRACWTFALIVRTWPVTTIWEISFRVDIVSFLR